MSEDNLKYRNKSIRLKGFDYTSLGAYFITICTWDKVCIFGKILNCKMKLNDIGKIAREQWVKTPKLRSNVILDEFVFMPDHFHGIIIIQNKNDIPCRITARRDPTGVARRDTAGETTTEQFGKPVKNSIPTIIRSYKSAVTKHINEYHNTPGHPVWQRNYYEHIIRNEWELNRIRQYIINNPLKWEMD